jgi:Mg/Co/Ni transporter MgtE
MFKDVLFAFLFFPAALPAKYSFHCTQSCCLVVEYFCSIARIGGLGPFPLKRLGVQPALMASISF